MNHEYAALRDSWKVHTDNAKDKSNTVPQTSELGKYIYSILYGEVLLVDRTWSTQTSLEVVVVEHIIAIIWFAHDYKQHLAKHEGKILCFLQ